MDAKIKRVQHNPAKFDDDGFIEKEPSATVTLDVPLDSVAQHDAIAALQRLLSTEWVTAEIHEKQLKMDVSGK